MSDPHHGAGSRTFPRYRLLGTAFDALTLEEFFGVIGDAVSDGRYLRVLHHNMHSLALSQHDPKLREAYEDAGLIFIDGSPIVGIARVLGYPVRYAHRLAVLDWFWPLLELANRNRWRVLHIGSSDAVIETAERHIRDRVPGVDFVTMSGYFDKQPGSVESDRVLEEISMIDPDIVLLGFGMPLQEHWLVAVEKSLPTRPVITVGGILGFVGGERPPAPRWTGRFGVEWAYRLMTEPSRLRHRYLVEPWALARPLSSDLWRRRVSAGPPSPRGR